MALCHGLLRPRLLISAGLLRDLSSNELRAVLHHEREHLRRYDPLRLLLARAFAEALPSRRAFQELAARLPLAQELAADRAAIAAVGPHALARALLKVGARGAGKDAARVAVAGMLGVPGGAPVVLPGHTLDARLDQLLLDEPPTVPRLPCFAAIATALALLPSPLGCLGGIVASYAIVGPSLLGGLRRRAAKRWAFAPLVR